MQRISFGLPLLIALLLVARVFFLSQTPSRKASDVGTGELSVAQFSESTASKHDHQIITSIDDPAALVILTPGPDGMPGQAGIDDGGNGTTDERGELGATGSDDICKVVYGPKADSLSADQQGDSKPNFIIVQRGAFRPLRDGESIPNGTPVRELVRWTDNEGRSREILRDR